MSFVIVEIPFINLTLTRDAAKSDWPTRMPRMAVPANVTRGKWKGMSIHHTSQVRSVQIVFDEQTICPFSLCHSQVIKRDFETFYVEPVYETISSLLLRPAIGTPGVAPYTDGTNPQILRLCLWSVDPPAFGGWNIDNWVQFATKWIFPTQEEPLSRAVLFHGYVPGATEVVVLASNDDSNNSQGYLLTYRRYAPLYTNNTFPGNTYRLDSGQALIQPNGGPQTLAQLADTNLWQVSFRDQAPDPEFVVECTSTFGTASGDAILFACYARFAPVS